MKSFGYSDVNQTGTRSSVEEIKSECRLSYIHSSGYSKIGIIIRVSVGIRLKKMPSKSNVVNHKCRRSLGGL